ncbi:hypothetical protein K457DRAFT_135840 [Linnemannia elongata AG-77]|uniref:Uncharacterized protein n=1 Tax=Linnemannia elongata AG-77 TaxID=1314771 RepID=A0A197K4R0_9FUNG|nr:hypothetical protein K457DRAFT_135840 [Linnemannia elongata AG-77]
MTTTHLKSLLSGSNPADKSTATKAPTQQPSAATPAATNNNNSAVQDKVDTIAATQEGKASDHMLTTGSRKRSILLNMMLPPEAPAVDAKLALPPVILFPPVLEPEGSITIQDRSMDVSASETHHATTSNSTSWSLRSWAWGGKDGAGGGGQISKRSKSHTQGEVHKDKGKHGHGKHDGGGVKKDGIVKTVNVVESKTTTTVSKTTQVRTWISKIGGSRSDESNGKQASVVPHSTIATGASNTIVSEDATIPGGMVQQQRQQQLTTSESQQSTSQVQVDQHGNVMAVQQRQEIIHQEIHQKTRSVALVSVNVSVSDVFGIGKVMEVILALFHAHGAFLRRNPFWLQCVLMAWEGVVVLMLVWGVLRVVGLAEVIVWGADDLIRGTLSTVQMVGRTLQSYLTPY